jgi:hypothetical protein
MSLIKSLGLITVMTVNAPSTMDVAETFKYCSVIHGAYLAGCTEVNNGKRLTDLQIKSIVDKCNNDAISFAKKIDACSQVEYTK